MTAALQDVDPHLEREYDVRKLRTDFDELGRDWVARSRRLLERNDAVVDIAYGDKPRQRLDIIRSGADRAPLLVFIHGGYWQRGDKAMYGFVAEPFLNGGCDVCLVNYTLCPEGTLPGIAGEIRQALAWLWANAGEIGIERDSIHMCGHSAGGHLTALMQTVRWSAFDAALPDSILRSATPMSGLFDLHPLRATTISHALHLDHATADAQSPIMLSPAADVATLLILGGGETSAFHRQSERFREAWRPRLTKLDLYGEPEVDHFDLLNRMADSNSTLFRRMIDHITVS